MSINLQDDAGTMDLKNGASITQAVASGAATIKLRAAMYTLKGNVAPGAVSTAISVAFTYK